MDRSDSFIFVDLFTDLDLHTQSKDQITNLHFHCFCSSRSLLMQNSWSKVRELTSGICKFSSGFQNFHFCILIYIDLDSTHIWWENFPHFCESTWATHVTRSASAWCTCTGSKFFQSKAYNFFPKGNCKAPKATESKIVQSTKFTLTTPWQRAPVFNQRKNWAPILWWNWDDTIAKMNPLINFTTFQTCRFLK